MSTTDGDSKSRLSSALEEILSKGAKLPQPVVEGGDEPEPTVEHDAALEPPQTSAPALPVTSPVPAVESTEPVQYDLPEIIPATSDLSRVDEAAAPETILAPALPSRPPETRTAGLPTQTPLTPAPAPEPAPAPAGAAVTPAPTRAATSWGDHMTHIPASAQGGPLRAPGRRPRVRRVTRVLRHIDPWSTFKVALIFSLVAYVVVLTAGVLLWRVAENTGTLDNVERWFTQFGWETFELKGGEVFHNAWIIGLFGVVGMTGGLVLLATLFNLVSDIIGGIRLTVLEEEVVERTVTSTRRYVVRRSPGAATAAGDALANSGEASNDWDVDGDAPVADINLVSADWSVDDE